MNPHGGWWVLGRAHQSGSGEPHRGVGVYQCRRYVFPAPCVPGTGQYALPFSSLLSRRFFSNFNGNWSDDHWLTDMHLHTALQMNISTGSTATGWPDGTIWRVGTAAATLGRCCSCEFLRHRQIHYQWGNQPHSTTWSAVSTRYPPGLTPPWLPSVVSMCPCFTTNMDTETIQPGFTDLEHPTGPSSENSLLTPRPTTDLGSDTSSTPQPGETTSQSNTSPLENGATCILKKTHEAAASYSKVTKSITPFKPSTLFIQKNNSKVIQTSGHYDDQQASLEVQSASFFNSQQYPEYFNITFPASDLSKDVSDARVENDIFHKLEPVQKILKVNKTTLLIQITSPKQVPLVLGLKALANLPVTTTQLF